LDAVVFSKAPVDKRIKHWWTTRAEAEAAWYSDGRVREVARRQLKEGKFLGKGLQQEEGPPDYWRAKKKREGRDEEGLMAEWWGLSADQRKETRRTHATHETVVSTAAVESGSASVRQSNVAAKGGYTLYATKEDAAAGKAETNKAANDRASADKLAFNLKYAAGCSTPGCPMASCLPAYVELDHLDPSTKSGNVSHMAGASREAEMTKVRPLCKACHRYRTAKQKGWRPADDRSTSARDFDNWKTERGCEHPLHSSMQWAKMDLSGCLERSCIRRGVANNKLPRREERHYKYELFLLRMKLAVVHCIFCHTA
jgi:hypothetical protein